MAKASKLHPDEPLIEPIDDPGGVPVIALLGGDGEHFAYQLGSRELDWHHHVRGQLFCVESGLVHVRSSHGSYLLPPHRAGWMPPGEPHRASLSGAASGWTVIVAPGAALHLPGKPCVIGISELMQALVRRASAWAAESELTPEQYRVIDVLLDEIRRAPQEPLHLPMPSDPRVSRIARRIYEHPDERRTLEQWAEWGALSARSLRRLIQAETGLSFGQWRQQAGLVHALEMLARGVAVAEVADALGYASPSNFIAMFRRAFGDSPARYFASR